MTHDNTSSCQKYFVLIIFLKFFILFFRLNFLMIFRMRTHLASSAQTMTYFGGPSSSRGTFHWTLDFTWEFAPLKSGQQVADPIM